MFFGPFEIPPGQSQVIITADEADVILASFFDDDDDFGRRVAPLYDVTGDGVQDLRVQSRYTHDDGLQYILTHVLHGGRTDGHPDGGELLFVSITSPCPNNFWVALDGDVLGDQMVTEDDLARVAANWGMEGQYLTRFDGDLNEDGIVNELDFFIVSENMDTVGSLVLFAWEVPVPPEIDPW